MVNNLCHIVRISLLSTLLSLLTIPVFANEDELGGLHCGDVVTIIATPDVGYRFVRWSDGNTDNPREIEITEAVELTAIYEQVCLSDTVPVLWLYNQLMMIHVDSLQRMGYSFTEQSVHWYRIVGDIDATSGESNDELMTTGYYYVPDAADVGRYYAAVDISATPQSDPPRCTDVLYSPPIEAGNTALYETTLQGISLVPNYGYPGSTMQLMGLKPELYYTIQVYDAVGRRLEDYGSQGETEIPIVAQRLPGYYLLRVTNKDGKTVLRYVVKQ